MVSSRPFPATLNFHVQKLHVMNVTRIQSLQSLPQHACSIQVHIQQSPRRFTAHADAVCSRKVLPCSAEHTRDATLQAAKETVLSGQVSAGIKSVAAVENVDAAAEESQGATAAQSSKAPASLMEEEKDDDACILDMQRALVSIRLLVMQRKAGAVCCCCS